MNIWVLRFFANNFKTLKDIANPISDLNSARRFTSRKVTFIAQIPTIQTAIAAPTLNQAQRRAAASGTKGNNRNTILQKRHTSIKKYRSDTTWIKTRSTERQITHLSRCKSTRWAQIWTRIWDIFNRFEVIRDKTSTVQETAFILGLLIVSRYKYDRCSL